MNELRLKGLYEQILAGQLPEKDFLAQMKDVAIFEEAGVSLDFHRELRQGFPEIIYSAGKSVEHFTAIVTKMKAMGVNVIGTRTSEEQYLAVKDLDERMVYHREARVLSLIQQPPKKLKGFVAVVCAGTSDVPVAEEAAVTAELLGCEVWKGYDVGVAGIHRLLKHRGRLAEATVVIAVAGMEGALPSVVGGLTDAPVIAVPTSVGYGASFGGISALLTMLNSCASGVSVVNIDNGFGAGYSAASILRKAGMLNDKA